MEKLNPPWNSLSKKSIPKQLREVIQFIFQSSPKNVALVGGTALSGFYFAHRRSDDIDLFVKNITSFKSLIRIIKKLEDFNVQFQEQEQFPQYFHALCLYKGHHFTIDCVLDPSLFNLSHFHCFTVSHNIQVPDLISLFKMKIATLVSRCSEKDLYDLLMLFKTFPFLNLENLISFGQEVDGGVSSETILLSVGGTILNQSSCNFSIHSEITSKDIYQQISLFQKSILQELFDSRPDKKNIDIKKIIQDLKDY